LNSFIGGSGEEVTDADVTSVCVPRRSFGGVGICGGGGGEASVACSTGII